MSKTASHDSHTLVEASSFLIDRGFCALIWLDEELVVRERASSLVEFVSLDQPVGSALLPLFGCEDDINALRGNPRHRFELANVKIIGAKQESPRLSLYVHWLETSRRFLVIVVRATMQSGIEAELENQSRRRALAEAKSIEQAKALERANAELTRANRELDEFANIISHDLKSPMRGLRYLAEDIEQALERSDTKAATALLADLKQQARRMSRMLTDLLAYARIGPDSEETTADTDTHALVETIIASLPRPRGFTIELAGQWPLMRTVSAALDVVLRNLIDNAIKHHDRADGRLVLSARTMKQGFEVSISDDGPGIEPKYHEAIFHPFRTLDLKPGSEERSSGIGLSFVRKTVETNGATLTLESAPLERRGTTFRLEWPGELLAQDGSPYK